MVSSTPKNKHQPMPPEESTANNACSVAAATEFETGDVAVGAVAISQRRRHHRSTSLRPNSDVVTQLRLHA